MPLTVWTQASGSSLGTFQENTSHEIALPISTSTGITFQVISGTLPPGMRLISIEALIIGSAYQVPRPTVFEFCIRASGTAGISDRTFKITIEGFSSPEFVTPAGPLDVFTPNQYFVLDSTYVDFQIEAIDTYTPAIDDIRYFIASGDGELPPGLTLSPTGRIRGLVAPAYTITPLDGDGSYDNTYYDTVAFDF